MAWIFVRLKARLIRNGLRGTQRIVGMVVAVIYGTILAVIGFAVMASAGSRAHDGSVVALLLTAVLVVGWAIVPVLGFGSDETLDPTRLVLLPLRRRDLMSGLLAASVVGIGPVATLIVLSGALVGFAPLGPAAAVVLLGVLVQLAMCLSLSRALVTALSSLLRSRKGRDLRLLIVPLVALLPQLLRFVYVPRNTSVAGLRPVAHTLSWVPAFFPMRAVVAAGEGHVAVAIVELIGGAATVGLLCWWWARSLEQVTTTADRQPAQLARPAKRAEGRVAASRPTPDPLFGAALGWLPRTRSGAVAAREARTSWRDPRRRVQTISTVVFPFLFMAGILARGVANRPALPYAALLTIALSGARVNNQLGLDGRAWWVHEAVGADWRADLAGKNLGLAAVSLTLTALTAVILAALSGGWTQLPAVALLAVALCLVQLAIGNVVSIRAPWAVPESRSNAFAANTGQGCFAGLVQLLALGALGLLSVPGIIAVAVVHSTLSRVVVAAAGAAYGYGLWRLGTAMAIRSAHRRGPEILAALDGSAGPR